MFGRSKREKLLVKDNHKKLSVEDIEMIDSHYFYILKEPKVCCLEITEEPKDFLTDANLNNEKPTSIGLIGIYLPKENRDCYYYIYTSDSLNELREYTKDISLANESEIKEFIPKFKR